MGVKKVPGSKDPGTFFRLESKSCGDFSHLRSAAILPDTRSVRLQMRMWLIYPTAKNQRNMDCYFEDFVKAESIAVKDISA